MAKIAKPLVSQDPHPRDMQFAHFGVLNTGGQDKKSLFTSITINVLLALVIVIVGAAARQKVIDNRVKEAIYVAPIKPVEPPKPPPPKLIPPKPIPQPPKPVVVPKIELPKVIPDPPKPVEVKVAPPKPMPVVTPAPPKVVVAAAAPKPTTVNLGHAASVPNNDPHPAAVSLGSTTNPIAPSSRPAVSNVNMGQSGMAGMPPGSGRGPAATSVNMGSGQPNGSISGGGARAVAGVSLGVKNGTPGGTGNGVGRTEAVTLARATPPPAMPTPTATKAPLAHPPVVTYKPRPTYTADATQNHVEGQIQVHIRVSASGQVTVMGLVGSGLGHGLDQSALSAAQGIRFKPALDANGSPIEWEGNVTITFQLA